jgi:hypothetical protein
VGVGGGARPRGGGDKALTSRKRAEDTRRLLVYMHRRQEQHAHCKSEQASTSYTQAARRRPALTPHAGARVLGPLPVLAVVNAVGFEAISRLVVVGPRPPLPCPHVVPRPWNGILEPVRAWRRRSFLEDAVGPLNAGAPNATPTKNGCVATEVERVLLEALFSEFLSEWAQAIRVACEEGEVGGQREQRRWENAG